MTTAGLTQRRSLSSYEVVSSGGRDKSPASCSSQRLKLLSIKGKGGRRSGSEEGRATKATGTHRLRLDRAWAFFSRPASFALAFRRCKELKGNGMMRESKDNRRGGRRSFEGKALAEKIEATRSSLPAPALPLPLLSYFKLTSAWLTLEPAL